MARSAKFAVLLLPWCLHAQTFSQQGFLQTSLTGYPQTAPNDSGQFVGDALLDWEPSMKWSEFRFNAGFNAEFDTHGMVQRSPDVSFWDRGTLRPALDVSRLNASWAHGPVTIELGKQVVRWGKTDILNPTDRFAPRDYLTVIGADVLAVTAARVTIASQTDSLDLVYTPRFTPSRAPLLDQRWVVEPEEARGLPLIDGGANFPGGGQYGIRWNRMSKLLEYSFSYFHGFNHLPWLEGQFEPALGGISVRRNYAELDTVGADAAIPLPWFTVKAEAAWYDSNTPQADRYVLYVVQAERQSGEWMFLGGYTGEAVTGNRNEITFDPERGLAKALVGRASLTINTRSSVTFEAAVRQNGQGLYGKLEYSRMLGRHWRVTGRIVGLHGDENDFLGQYSRNSFGSLIIRYSF
jgi:hypothetical protein